MTREFKHAIVKFNNGFNALLCNKCNHIVQEGFHTRDVEDKEHLCQKCEANQNFFVRGINWRP